MVAQSAPPSCDGGGGQLGNVRLVGAVPLAVAGVLATIVGFAGLVQLFEMPFNHVDATLTFGGFALGVGLMYAVYEYSRR